jgi:3-deoxy-manno-octulosonate cytidylyltransferase (CMP-KDO synthetase)
MNEFHVLIPARLASTRLPEKALADLCGKPLIVRVWENALGAGADSVTVATDSERIADAVREAGGRVVMTRDAHDSGTSRLVEAADTLGLDRRANVVNIQGDEPAVPVACIRQLVALLEADPEADMATLWVRLNDSAEWRNPSVVKLVADHAQRAMYFSRAPIPASRDRGFPDGQVCRHLGLYAYRVDALKRWAELPESPLERYESLEQLRALQAGWRIACAEAEQQVPPGVDTEHDLEAMRHRFQRKSGHPVNGVS